MAFAIGFAVSIIQLTCTSPLYIGVAFLVHNVPELRVNAFLYLLLYNLAYIAALGVIFVLAYLGTTCLDLWTVTWQPSSWPWPCCSSSWPVGSSTL